ncbi:MAG: phosphohydrolase [Deltaproteobacteria bacterium]|nr:phosphohydrolase [Deltaproteobacteria bacterium]MBW2404470.1 phosphohydrolase [Deltaproteobacteria bacterium]MBW2545831.1 phosphohydrolase [Deltaproteobacteria bacterium]MBW2719388.1 phosphohydrolase [Deltaproteobacteria bacterium]
MENSPLIDEVLDRYRDPLGPHYPRYRGHVHRVYHYTRHLIVKNGGDPDPDDSAIAVAAAFHDLSFATDQTLDYLPPSIISATEHLETLGLAELAPAVGRMIGFHHKLTPYRAEDANLVEPFRRADLVDLFAVPGVGVPFALRREAQLLYPKCGFRGFVCRTLLLGALKQPWRPAPMLRW